MSQTIRVPPDVRSHRGFDGWLAFHIANKEVMRGIVRELCRAKAAGIRHTSVKMIINVLRWEQTIAAPDKPYKINDRYTGIYTHMIAYNFPEYRSMIERRRLRSVTTSKTNS